MGICADISINVISDLITLGLLFGVAWLVFVFLRRNPILKFFNIQRDKKLAIYLSNIEVERSKGVDGVSRNYKGTAVVFGEQITASEFINLFNYPFPASDDKPGILKQLRIADVNVELIPSPLNDEGIEHHTSFITIGSPGYNRASGFFEQKGSKAKFQKDNTEIIVNDIPLPKDSNYAFVARIVDRDNQRSLFYTAGISEQGTKGAVYYLATRWKDLQKRYGNQKDFAIALKIDQGDYRKSQVVGQ
jgi:hypothetical protein